MMMMMNGSGRSTVDVWSSVVVISVIAWGEDEACGT